VSGKRQISETLFDKLGLRMTYEADEVLYEERTAHQHLVLFKNKTFGKVLVLDGVVQITTRDQAFYQEMMSHVPLFGHGGVLDVLIIGGGDCGVAKQVLKHASVRQVIQVEIDPKVVEFSQEHFPELTRSVFADRRFKSVTDDGMKFVARTKQRFDVIIVDSTDPHGPGKVLFSRRFYEACGRCLSPRGILVTQNGVPFFQSSELVSSLKKFKKIFRHSGCYTTVVPTYVGGFMTLGWASPAIDLSGVDDATLTDRYDDAGMFETKYWTPALQAAAFVLPRFIEDIVRKAKN
jgi:spermidine synthase